MRLNLKILRYHLVGEGGTSGMLQVWQVWQVPPGCVIAPKQVVALPLNILLSSC